MNNFLFKFLRSSFQEKSSFYFSIKVPSFSITLKFSVLKVYILHWIFLPQTSLSFISSLKIVKVVKREFVIFVVAKSLLTSFALCYLSCRGLNVEVVYSRSCVDLVVSLWKFICRLWKSFTRWRWGRRAWWSNLETNLLCLQSLSLFLLLYCYCLCLYFYLSLLLISIVIAISIISFTFIALIINLFHHSYLSIFLFQSRRQLSTSTLI